jgi:diadenosine tetraphosphatase ApaH/serine/threonine PP2A family protein phosphatase
MASPTAAPARLPISVAALRQKLERQERLELHTAIRLIRAGTQRLADEPTLLEIDAPACVIGDVHGQFYDLLALLDRLGAPSPSNKLVFLGDYVDRGAFSCEVLLLLLALKLEHPACVFLLRGNHEDEAIASHYGFRAECETKYGLSLFYHFCSVFAALPIGAVVTSSDDDGVGGGVVRRVLCLHGGLSPHATTLAALAAMPRQRRSVLLPAGAAEAEREQTRSALRITRRGDSGAKGGDDSDARALAAIQRQLLGDSSPLPPGFVAPPCDPVPLSLGPTAAARQEADDTDEAGGAGGQKPCEEELVNALVDTLWSDPLPDELRDAAGDLGSGGGSSSSSSSSSADSHGFAQHWMPNRARGCSYFFGAAAARAFLATNGLDCLIRAHELQQEGFQFHFDGDADRGGGGSDAVAFVHWSHLDVVETMSVPPVITVFSAPNYCGRFGNKGGFVRIGAAAPSSPAHQRSRGSGPLLRVEQYSATMHPPARSFPSRAIELNKQLTSALPYMPATGWVAFFTRVVALRRELDDDAGERTGGGEAANGGGAAGDGEAAAAAAVAAAAAGSGAVGGEHAASSEGVRRLQAAVKREIRRRNSWSESGRQRRSGASNDGRSVEEAVDAAVDDIGFEISGGGADATGGGGGHRAGRVLDGGAGGQLARAAAAAVASQSPSSPSSPPPPPPPPLSLPQCRSPGTVHSAMRQEGREWLQERERGGTLRGSHSVHKSLNTLVDGTPGERKARTGPLASPVAMQPLGSPHAKAPRKAGSARKRHGSIGEAGASFSKKEFDACFLL